MAGRVVSEANVMSKQNKMGKQLGLLVEKNKRVEFHHDMQWLKSELLENPDKMACIKAVAKMKVCKPKEKNSFDDRLAGKYVERLPLRFLEDIFLVGKGMLTKPIMRAESNRPDIGKLFFVA
jgi:hypothetical protein